MKLNTRQWKIYEYLKENCVGKENQKQGAEIISALQEAKVLSDTYTPVSLKGDIKAIRRNETVTRRIGSNNKGYWLMLEDEDGLEYIRNLTTSHLKTAVSQGIPTAYFHQVLNTLADNDLTNNQKKMQFTGNEHDEVKLYSDDLKKGN